jgi:hypothetical protein
MALHRIRAKILMRVTERSVLWEVLEPELERDQSRWKRGVTMALSEDDPR